MDIPDIINGSFELLGAPFIFMSIMKIYKDKQVRGISWTHPTFFTAWGFWNLYYYPHLNQWASFVGGIFIAAANLIWVIQLIYYWKKEKTKR